MIGHILRLHVIVGTGACDIFGTKMWFCQTCQSRGKDVRWYNFPKL